MRNVIRHATHWEIVFADKIVVSDHRTYEKITYYLLKNNDFFCIENDNKQKVHFRYHEKKGGAGYVVILPCLFIFNNLSL